MTMDRNNEPPTLPINEPTPPENEVPPTTVAATEFKLYPSPNVRLPVPIYPARMRPAVAARPLEIMYVDIIIKSTFTPESLAAFRLPPTE
jgi:hypothetical protein